jgi:hypothetical protein
LFYSERRYNWLLYGRRAYENFEYSSKINELVAKNTRYNSFSLISTKVKTLWDVN